jgi:hypothetical protein
VWAGYQLNIFITGGAFEFLALLQGIILVVMGGSQVSAAVNGARASGILDFHRVSPLSPAELTLGFFFGAPIREYILFASIFPYVAICLAIGAPTFRGMVQVEIFLLTVAWVFQGLALLNGLISRARTNTRGAIAIVIFFLYLFYSALRVGRFAPSAVLFDGDLRADFYGYSLPWLVVMLSVAVPLLFFIYIAASRKMDSERFHPFTKLQALAALGALCLLTLGIIWRQQGYDVLEVSLLYIVVVIAVLLTTAVTPSRAEYLKGLWRARRVGRAHLSWWDDLAINRVFLFLACLLVLFTGNLAWSQSESAQGFVRNSTDSAIPLATAMGVLVVAYFGLGIQFFLMGYGPRGKIYFGLFLFFAWLVPLVAGSIMAMASAPLMNEAASEVLASLSPVVGIATIASPSGRSSITAATFRQGAAITPALLYAFLFNSLLIAARRRTHREFENAAVQPRAEVSHENDKIAGQLAAASAAAGGNQ